MMRNLSTCDYCRKGGVGVFLTTRGKYGCRICTARLKQCQVCEVYFDSETGKWWDDGLAYCNRCASAVPKCVWCDRPAFESATPPGQPTICGICAPNFPRCDHCQELISGSCLTYVGHVYCRACSRAHPHCLDCGQLITVGPDCPDCAGPARACGLCGALHADRWMVYDSTWFCPKCYWQACGRCRFCQEEFPRSIGGTVCPGCRAPQVTDLNVARDLLDEVHWFCREELGLQVNRPYQLRLVNTSADMPKLSNDAYTLSLSTVGLWSPRDRTMFVARNFPIWFTTVILAHEHTHAWQQENCPRQAQDVLEGFASWVEYRTAHNLGYTTFAENMIKFDCPIYGRGLRRCLQLESQVGTLALVDKMRSLRTFSLWTSFWAMLSEA